MALRVAMASRPPAAPRQCPIMDCRQRTGLSRLPELDSVLFRSTKVFDHSRLQLKGQTLNENVVTLFVCLDCLPSTYDFRRRFDNVLICATEVSILHLADSEVVGIGLLRLLMFLVLKEQAEATLTTRTTRR